MGVNWWYVGGAGYTLNYLASVVLYLTLRHRAVEDGDGIPADYPLRYVVVLLWQWLPFILQVTKDIATGRIESGAERHQRKQAEQRGKDETA